MVIIWVLIFAACSSPAASSPASYPVSTSPVAEKNQNIQLDLGFNELSTQKHLSRNIEIGLTDSLTVNLASNPTTGFQWSDPLISPGDIVSFDSRLYLGPQAGVVGAGGKDVFFFKPLKAGTSVIKFSYSRPWEGGEKDEWTVELSVKVR